MRNITIGLTVAGMFEDQATPDDLNDILTAAVKKLGVGVVQRFNEFDSALKVNNLVLRLTDTDKPGLCVVTGLPDMCNVYALDKVNRISNAKYAGCFIGYPTLKYDNVQDAIKNNDALAFDPVAVLDTFTVQAAIGGFDIANKLSGSVYSIVYITKQLFIINERELLTAMRKGDDLFFKRVSS